MIRVFTCLILFGHIVISTSTTCTANNIQGTCIDTSSCSGKSVPGKCPGAVNIQCCIPTTPSCIANGQNGVCVDTLSCSVKPVPGKCPGAANIQCCISNSDSGSSSDGLCGSYIGAPVSSIAGNDNVMYSVVKIKQEHLTDPSTYSLPPTSSDNTMTTQTACAFDKMASAAKQDGVIITISSGFRTLVRQQYFWNCYQTQSCNNGNLAAKPGTSNHGKGIALDLNTNCGKQTGSKPDCNGSKVYQWLYNNADKYGFTRTVQSEPWHWEFRGIGVSRASFA
ncbi:unnamed protein product [Adineta steineri]|uniref:D-alanyl-D-alanine carboxypeptidase-like core domain-containing protein n=1 Tax=Adineta steineri TaxID=433720 RepID=A0A814NIA4_9BILA|nr:unnamed protein product [Adineta steineri]CAF1183339.1 unnamed protein product [Adineta steineri]